MPLSLALVKSVCLKLSINLFLLCGPHGMQEAYWNGGMSVRVSVCLSCRSTAAAATCGGFAAELRSSARYWLTAVGAMYWLSVLLLHIYWSSSRRYLCCVYQQLLEEHLSAKQGLYLAAFGTSVQPLWTSQAPRVLNTKLYDKLTFLEALVHICTLLALVKLLVWQ